MGTPVKPVVSKETIEEQKKSSLTPIIFISVIFIFFCIGAVLYIAITKFDISVKPKGTAPVLTSPTLSFLASREIPTPSDDWLTYADAKAGFQLRYPKTVLFNAPGKGATEPILTVSVETIESIPESLPLGMGRGEAIADKESLEKGVAQTIGDFAASDALVRIGGTYNGRMTSVLSRFEICSVIFSRKLVFYPNNYRVMVSLGGAEEEIIKAMPEFFTIDAKNCGERRMWNRDKRGEFMPTLDKGQGRGAAQVWYDTFTAILKTIELIPVTAVVTTASPTPMPTTSGCEVTDNAFCNVLADMKHAIATKNYQGLLSYQLPQTVTCDPDGMYVAICEGVGKGVVKEGYGIGYNQSEGTVQLRDAYLATFASYIATNGPFTYRGSLVSGDKGIIVYLNNDTSKLLAFRMHRTGATWRFTSPLLGGIFGNTSYSTMSPSLLE